MLGKYTFDAIRTSRTIKHHTCIIIQLYATRHFAENFWSLIRPFAFIRHDYLLQSLGNVYAHH